MPVLNPVVIPGLRAGNCCAVVRGSLYVCIIQCNSAQLSCLIKKAIIIIIITSIAHPVDAEADLVMVSKKQLH